MFQNIKFQKNIGDLNFSSEEPSESNNKFVRRYREKLCRKFSRQKNLTDLFTRLIALSDPKIHTKWDEPTKKTVQKGIMYFAHF